MTTTIVTRSGKGSPLTNTELDANFTNLKTTADAAISSTGNNTLSGNLIVTGDFEVQGTTTSIDSTTVEITDLNITLAKDATNATQANGAGITIAGSNAELKYVSTGDKWTLNKNLEVTGTIQDSNGTFLPSSSVSTFGGTLIDDADAAAARTTLGLGTAATSATGDFLAISGGTLTGNLSLGTNTISSGAITASGDSAVGGSTNISMSAASAGQFRVFGSGYTGSIALDENAMHVYHNSSSRDLVLGTNETARLNISGTGLFDFQSNNLQSIGTISSGAITSTVNNTASVAQIATDSNAVLLLENTNASGSAGIRLRGGNGAGVLMYGENNNTDKFHLVPRNDTSKAFTLDHVGAAEFSGSVGLSANTSFPTAGFSSKNSFNFS